MAKLPHLQLERLERTEDRRKPSAPLSPPDRGSARAYGDAIKRKIDIAVAAQAALPKIEGIDPELILKVKLATAVEEDEWRRAGLTVLAQEPGGILVLFTDDAELKSFRTRLAEYQKGAQGDRKQPSYNGVFASIDDIGSITDSDRIGARLRSDGIESVDAIDGRASFTVDIELWDAPTQLDRQVRVQHLVKHIESAGGEILSRYIGSAGLIVLRARLRGTALKSVLAMPAVARVDLRPVPDLGEREPPVVTLANIPAAAQPPADAPIIGIIDSGSTEHPLLAPSLIESLGIPAALGTADEWGHGTKVAGIAAFGDLRECVDTRTFASPVRIVSVRVVNERGEFDDTTTIPDQMEQAIRALHERGCRIINIALGDQHRIPYDGGRVSSWAATLDTLARELDVLVIVSAGNSVGGARAPWGAQAEHITRTYPAYLVSPENRLVEPATAAIALTV
jgi:subtilisin family serine protease